MGAIQKITESLALSKDVCCIPAAAGIKLDKILKVVTFPYTVHGTAGAGVALLQWYSV